MRSPIACRCTWWSATMRIRRCATGSRRIIARRYRRAGAPDAPVSLEGFAGSAVRAYQFATTPPMGPVLLMANHELQSAPAPAREPRIPKLTMAAPPQRDVSAGRPAIVCERGVRTEQVCSGWSRWPRRCRRCSKPSAARLRAIANARWRTAAGRLWRRTSSSATSWLMRPLMAGTRAAVSDAGRAGSLPYYAGVGWAARSRGGRLASFTCSIGPMPKTKMAAPVRTMAAATTNAR